MAEMIEEAIEQLEKPPAVLVAGAFLLASLLLPLVGYRQADALAWVTVLICGIPILEGAVERLVGRRGLARISSDLLISMAMVASIVIGELFAAGEVAFIMAIGEILEDMTTRRARKGLHKLISLAPETARIVEGGTVREVPAEQVGAGDIVRVLPGERIPVDGEILVGESSVDQSIMTGESLPVDVGPGAEVYSGTLNRFGSVDLRATKVGQESSLSRLIRLVREAEENQAPIVRIADRWASWLVPASLVVAVATYLLTGDAVRAVTVLVVFCPCALVLATPTAIVAAVGQAARNGVVVKSGEALERMGRVSAVAFDKTGTLTRGELEVSDVLPLGELSRGELLAAVASAEARSEHPLARAILAGAQAEGLALPDATGFAMTAGRGVRAEIGGEAWLAGNEGYLVESGVSLGPEVRGALEELRAQGKACVIAARGGAVEGILALSDAVRPEAAHMVAELKAMGVRPVLLTGDNARAAGTIAAGLGIADVRADLLPGQKVARIAELQRSATVCMVGDGVNDAPALKSADVGVAMGAMGSDIAVEAADVALMSDDVSRLPYLKWLSNTCVRTIRVAIALAMSINLVGVILSVKGLLTPVTGALVHNCGSVFVVLLAALLYERRYPGFSAERQTAGS